MALPRHSIGKDVDLPSPQPSPQRGEGWGEGRMRQFPSYSAVASSLDAALPVGPLVHPIGFLQGCQQLILVAADRLASR